MGVVIELLIISGGFLSSSDDHTHYSPHTHVLLIA
jgi:hypothetical protein